MPRAGGLLDQDAAWVRDIELLDAMDYQIELEYIEYKEQERKEEERMKGYA